MSDDVILAKNDEKRTGIAIVPIEEIQAKLDEHDTKDLSYSMALLEIIDEVYNATSSQLRNFTGIDEIDEESNFEITKITVKEKVLANGGIETITTTEKTPIRFNDKINECFSILTLRNLVKSNIRKAIGIEDKSTVIDLSNSNNRVNNDGE